MNKVFNEGILFFRKNTEIVLQYSVTILRPVLFTLLINSLRDEESLRYFIYAIGFIGFFAILDLVVQSYIRSRHLRSSREINLKGIFPTAVILMLLINWYGPINETLVKILVLVYFLNSLIFLYEYDLTKKKCIFYTYSSELLIASFSVFFILVGFRSEFLIFIAFVSFPIGRIIGLMLYRLTLFLSKDSFSNKVELPSPSKEIRSISYMAYCIAQAISGAIAGSLPVIFYNFSADYNLYTIALVYIRWFHVFGAIVSTIINVLGARIFYRTIDINIFVRNGHWLARNEAIIWILILLSFMLLSALMIYSNKVIITTMIASIFIIAVMNYFSSLLNAFARPDLSLICHMLILGLSCHVCSTIFNTTFIGLFSLAASFLVFISTYKIVIHEFRNLSEK